MTKIGMDTQTHTSSVSLAHTQMHAHTHAHWHAYNLTQTHAQTQAQTHTHACTNAELHRDTHTHNKYHSSHYIFKYNTEVIHIIWALIISFHISSREKSSHISLVFWIEDCCSIPGSSQLSVEVAVALSWLRRRRVNVCMNGCKSLCIEAFAKCVNVNVISHMAALSRSHAGFVKAHSAPLSLKLYNIAYKTH